MNAPAPTTLGIPTGTLGGFGVPGAAPTGLEGLFALLLGSGQPTAGTPGGLTEGLLGALLNQQTGDGPLNGDTLLGLLPQNVLEQLDTQSPDTLGAQLANLLSNQGEPGAEGLQATMQVNLQAVVVQVQKITVQLKQAGVDMSALGDTQALAAALVKLGMSPEEAAMKAAQIDTMLQLVRQMLDAPAEMGMGDLMAQILAASGMAATAPSPIVQVEAQITTATAEVAVVQVQISPHHARARLAQNANASGTDLARSLAGITALDEQPATDVPATQAVLPTEAAENDVATTNDQLPQPVANAAPQPGAVAAPVEVNTQPAEKPIMVQSAPTVEAVEAGREIKAPSGTEVLRATLDEQDNLQIDRKVDTLTLREAQVQSPPPAPPAKEVVNHGSFSERLAHATRADTTQQVVVQVKEMAGQGGGVVRMILNPPELGEIRIEMIVTNGKVEGSISATDNAVVELLARDVHSLKQGLGELGLKLGDNGVALMLSNGNQQQAQQDQRGQQPANTPQGWAGEGAETADTDLPDPATAARWVSPDRVLDMNV